MEEDLIFNATSSIETNIKIIKAIFIILITYYTNFKLNKIKKDTNIKNIIIITIFSIICAMLKYRSNHFISIMASVLIITFIYSKNDIKSGLLTTIVSMCINYMISFISIVISFGIAETIGVNNNYINLLIIVTIHCGLLMLFSKFKRFRYGLSFLQKSKKNEYIDLLIMNISVMILFSTIIFTDFNIIKARSMMLGIFIYVIMIFVTLQKSLELYYKQKLLEQELNKVKEELANKTKEIENLEAENVEISKKSHTLSHKQKALEYKLEEMMMNSEISQEEVGEVRDRLKAIGKDLYKEKTAIELDKTGISKIDDMLKYLQSECKKNKIDFELQIKGNIHYMTNNLISTEDLETLLADHIKNAIIAINHTDNINKSILVRLGEIDGIYSLYIYDSGIEFEKETLEHLGSKPSTTHADEGGTGMGFMNTFDTLRKCKASLIINEIGEPSKENYTKVIIIKFDNKNEFKIVSYRKQEVML